MKINKETKQLVHTIKLWFDVFLPQSCGYSPQTIASYKCAVGLFLDYLETIKDKKKMELTTSDFSKINIEKWLLWLKEERGNSKLSIDHRLAVIKSLVRYLRSRDHTLDYNYIEICEIKTISHGRGKKVEGLTKEAFRIFMESIDCSTKTGKRDYALFTFMYDTGCRVGEVLNIRLRDLQLDVKEPYVIVTGKGDKLRTLVLSDLNVETLRLYITLFFGNQPQDDAYLFYSNRGGITIPLNEDSVNARLSHIAKIAHRRCSDVPLHIHSHQIRHTAASHWFNIDNINIANISVYLGHNSIDVTRKYIGISKQELEQAMAKRSGLDMIGNKKYTNLKSGLRDLLK